MVKLSSNHSWPGVMYRVSLMLPVTWAVALLGLAVSVVVVVVVLEARSFAFAFAERWASRTQRQNITNAVEFIMIVKRSRE
jgi:hypothetical protein